MAGGGMTRREGPTLAERVAPHAPAAGTSMEPAYAVAQRHCWVHGHLAHPDVGLDCWSSGEPTLSQPAAAAPVRPERCSSQRMAGPGGLCRRRPGRRRPRRGLGRSSASATGLTHDGQMSSRTTPRPPGQALRTVTVVGDLSPAPARLR